MLMLLLMLLMLLLMLLMLLLMLLLLNTSFSIFLRVVFGCFVFCALIL